jgi:hypothetical protein
MNGLKPIDEHFERAFKLAYFINGSKQRAVSIVIAAMNKLETAATAQVKRLYYTPARRSHTTKAENHRTKVSLSELHLLQRLIYIESEPYERAREQLQDQDAPDAELLLIHFIKHLVKTTIKRNSFYVTLGISRLLHNYSTAETMEIYNVAVQDPELVKDDYYYRSRKGRLIQEMKERFGALISITRGPRGEERFETHDAPEEFVELVSECLDQFSPWNTSCPVPVAFDPVGDEIAPLAFSGRDDQDRVEINRIHAILHRDCYGRITKALRLESPERRLDIPHFFLPGGKNDMKRNGKQHRRSTGLLSIDELEAIKDTFPKQSARRKTTHADLLSIIIDGHERTRLNLKRSHSITLNIEDGDELIEVRAIKEDQETLLATHFLDQPEIMDDSLPLINSEIILEGGQRLFFVISQAQASLTVSYEETRWLPAALLSLQRIALRLSGAFGLQDEPARAFLKPALAGLLLTLCAGLLVLFIAGNFRRATPPQMDIAQSQQPPVINAAQTPAPPSTPAPFQDQSSKTQEDSSKREVLISKATTESAGKSATTQVERRRVPAQLPVRSGEQTRQPNSAPLVARASNAGSVPEDATSVDKSARGFDGATRALPRVSAATALAGVKKIYLDLSGDERLVQQLARLLSPGLQAGQRLSITQNKDEADAALKLNIKEIATGKTVNGNAGNEEAETLSAVVIVRLVNEDGAVIWPGTNRKQERRYNGTIKSVVSRIAADLLQDIRKSDTVKSK